MTPITLQISLPDKLELSAEELTAITGRKTTRQQMAWLDEHGWEFTLDAHQGPIVGKLYAHLRLAGMHPAHVNRTPAPARGFNMDAIR